MFTLAPWSTTTTHFALCSEKTGTSSSSLELVSAQHRVHSASCCLRCSSGLVVHFRCNEACLSRSLCRTPIHCVVVVPPQTNDTISALSVSRSKHMYTHPEPLLIFSRFLVPNAPPKAIVLLCASSDEPARVAPSAQTFRLATQNINILSTRTLPPCTPAPAYPIEITRKYQLL